MNAVMIALLILVGILLFGIVIFSHEFGHFFTAKLCGVKVNEFAIGMGPKIFSKVKGETRYSLRLLPIGGYCAMEGEDEESGDNRAFGNKPVWQRMLVLVAGGVMNMVLGFLLMIISLSFQDLGPENLFGTSTIAQFQENSVLHEAGLEPGDRITSVDGYAVYTFQDFSFAMALADPESVDFQVERNGARINFDNIKLAYTQEGDKKVLEPLNIVILGEKRDVGTVLRRSFTGTGSMVRMVVETLKGMVTGRFGLNDMAGPVGTAQVISEAAGEGLKKSFGDAVMNIITIIILISVNLGVVNLLPLPALDGGRILFLLFELVFRRPVPAKYEGIVHTVGFALLIGLMLVVTFNDIVRLVTGG